MDTQSRSLHGEELEGRAHRRGLRKDDLGRKHLGGLAGGSELAFLAVAGALGLLLVLGAALGVPLLAGVVVAYVLGFFVAAAAHGFVGSLLAGIFVKYRRRGWGYLDDIHHAVLPLIALVLAAALIRLDLWVVHVSIGAVHTLEYFAAATVGAALMTWLTYLALDPDRLKSSGTTRAICLLAILFGLVAGAVLMVATVGVSAWYRHAHLVQTAIPVSPISHMTGEYVALGDSYSAGEGLSPFLLGTGPVRTGQGNGCDRSNRAYSQILKFAGIPQPVKSFAACSGAVSSEIYSSFSRSTGAQADGGVHPDVGLVTLTIGGNDVLFSDVVRVCFQYTDCTKTPFPSPSPTRGLTFPISQPLATWGVAATEMVSQRLATLYGHLRATYPKARIVAIGYPYLFPSGKAGWWPDDCASILRRYSVSERAHIREFIDQFNDAAYERAVQAGIEFVSATAAWDGHEPCGAKGQWTNSIKPILSFHDPVDGGSFHPNQTGQQQLAALVACYLDTNSQAPNAFQGGASHPFTISGLEKPSQLGLVPAPGSAQAPLHCAGGK